MNRENAAKLIEALQSGRYEQGFSRLRTRYDQYCCLGVACDISGLGEWVLESDGWYYKVGDNADYAVMPKAVADWLGTTDGGEFFQPDRLIGSLAGKNDNGATFEQIASILEDASIEWVDRKRVEPNEED